ncbi:DUF2917 domain-containing protein [Polaromonas sp. YR568]|uniref:DUF2917 domain-containing protein n=1 Tax=Polaromonas sp. YR568 TaxID=1855301 RepID=UPI00313806B1
MNATDHLQASSPLGNPLQTLHAPTLTVTRQVVNDALAGCWKLAPGQALTLQASEPGVLRIAHGRVWVTFDHADDRASLRAGDYFLSRGQSLLLQAGESLVMESFGAGHAASAYFSWEPVPALQPAATAGSWRAGMVAPLADLRLAAGLAGRALGALARGLLVGASKSLGASASGLPTRLAMALVAQRHPSPAVQSDFDRFRRGRRGEVNVLALSNLT